MKTLKFFYLLFSFLIICNLSIFAISSEFDYPIVEKDSLFAQDTTIIEFDVGHYDPEMLRGVLSPYIVYWPDDCYECKEDSIWSLQTTLFEDTTFHFTFAVPHGSVPGIYRFSVIFGENSRVGGKNITIVTRPFIYQQPVGDTVCEGDTVKFEVKVLGNYGDEMNYQWYQNDEPFRSGRVTEMKPLIFALDTGSYYCRVSGYGGLDTSITVRLDWFEAPSKLSAPEGPVHFCPGSDTISYFIHSDPLSMGYNWHLTPDAAGTILQYDTAAQVIWDPAYSGLASLYVILESVCEVVTESLDIYVQGKSVSPDICIVGIDEETGKYRVVWEPSRYASAELFKVYRESNQLDVYLEIGTADPGEFSVFVDPSSAPDILSHRYKLSYIDTCANESELSIFHQTMHLAANLGIDNNVNLIWSEYKGIPFPAYDIYRGNNKDSLTLLRQVASSVNSFTDDDPPTGKIYYQIGISNPAGCNPTKKAGPDYSSSRSNMEQVYVSGIEEMNEDKLFTIYPNPVDKELQIRLKKSITIPIQYTIYNSLGASVLGGMITVGSVSLDVSSLSPGLYILKLSDDKETWSARFVINTKEY